MAGMKRKRGKDGSLLAPTQQKTIGGDPKLIPRILEIVNDTPSQTVADQDPEQLAQLLQQKFPEYQRKKRRDFKLVVGKALHAMSSPVRQRIRRLSKSEPPSPPGRHREESDGSGDVTVIDDANLDAGGATGTDNKYIEYPDQNAINSAVTNLYRAANDHKDRTESDSNVEKRKKKRRADEAAGGAGGVLSSARNPFLSAAGLIPSSSAEHEFSAEFPEVCFADLGGLDRQLTKICRLLIHMRHPQVFTTLGVQPPRGFLLHGPPGSGKTLLAKAVAGELQLPLFSLAATELVSGVSGESEMRIRRLFSQAKARAPCVVFVDEIDAITPKRETAQREMERRIVSQLLFCLDDLSSQPKSTALKEEEQQKATPNQVLVIGATTRPDALDPALRRAGRFDKEIALGMPDQLARQRILEVVCKGMRLADDVSLERIATLCPGFVGADLKSLTGDASVRAVNRVFESIDESKLDIDEDPTSSDESSRKELDKALAILRSESGPENGLLSSEKLNNITVTFADFELAMKTMQPSAKREGFATVPDVTWEDVGALRDIREELKWSILYPVQHARAFASFGLSSRAQGVLLCGPPGCGKTLLAKAVANHTRINFIAVKGPELLNMYVGESERAVRSVFQRARNSAPCVIFFDEIDALCPTRHGSATESSGRVVNQLLTEMDGIEARKSVFLMAATNRPDIVDPAVMRPGRLDKVLYVGFPTSEDRAEILQALTKNGTKPKLGADLSLQEVAADERCSFFTGADLAALVREASVAALKEVLLSVEETTPAVDSCVTGIVYRRHFDAAFANVTPSVSQMDRQRYARLKERYSSTRETVAT